MRIYLCSVDLKEETIATDLIQETYEDLPEVILADGKVYQRTWWGNIPTATYYKTSFEKLALTPYGENQNDYHEPHGGQSLRTS